MANLAIREAAIRNDIRLWQVADVLGIWDSSLSRKMRHELPEEETQYILNIIEALKDFAKSASFDDRYDLTQAFIRFWRDAQ